MVETWVLGMVINLCGNIFINIGTNCVKYEHAKTKQHRDNESLNSSGSGNSSVLSSGEQMDGTPNIPMPVSDTGAARGDAQQAER
jgi:hypothetical protein